MGEGREGAYLYLNLLENKNIFSWSVAFYLLPVKFISYKDINFFERRNY